MLKGEQEPMGLKSYKEEATQSKHVNAETKKKKKENKKLGFLGNGITLAKTCLRTQNQACMHRLDHAYVDPYPET